MSRKSAQNNKEKMVYIQLTGPVVTPRWLSIKQLCAYLGGMKPRHAADLLRDGKIQFHLVGKQKMVDRADADAWADKQPFFTGKLSKNGKPMTDEDAQKVIEGVRRNNQGFVVNISAPALAKTPDLQKLRLKAERKAAWWNAVAETCKPKHQRPHLQDFTDEEIQKHFHFGSRQEMRDYLAALKRDGKAVSIRFD